MMLVVSVPAALSCVSTPHNAASSSIKGKRPSIKPLIQYPLLHGNLQGSLLTGNVATHVTCLLETPPPPTHTASLPKGLHSCAL